MCSEAPSLRFGFVAVDRARLRRRFPPRQVTEADAAVASALLATEHHIVRHLLAIRHLADEREKVNEHAGRVELPVELARRVVVREHVVVVVVALADRTECHKEVLDGVDVLVVRLVAPQVGDAVHAPGHVQREGVTQRPHDVERRPCRLAPEVPRNQGREDEAGCEHQGDVVSERTVV